mmetsp:Transcript_106201/g.297315  ORF Transcript_106201/g.297315 Transcript_106201/m.297315 type:complete len:210 (-) Transcript_106201:395-1024(-)
MLAFPVAQGEPSVCLSTAPPAAIASRHSARLSPPPGLQDDALSWESVPQPFYATCRGGLSPSTPPSFDSAEPVKLAWTPTGVLAVSGPGGLLGTPTRGGALDLADASGRSPSEGSQSGEGNDYGPGSVQEEVDLQKKKRSRFCKAKRDHYRRLVEELVRRSRDGCLSLEGMKLPKSIASSEDARGKLLATVARFAQAAPRHEGVRDVIL